MSSWFRTSAMVALCALAWAALPACSASSAEVLDDEGTASRPLAAGEWIAPLAAGTWEDPVPETGKRDPRWRTVHVWADAKVANVRYDKRVLIELDVPYANGTRIRTVSHASYKGREGDGTERWGTDALEMYPDSGPHGAAMTGKAQWRARFQVDSDGNGADDIALTDWQPVYGEGEVEALTDDPWAPSLESPCIAGETSVETSAWFAPFDDPGAAVLREIDAVIAAKQADPAGRHTIHAAVFNISDERIVARLIAAHQAGVEVRLATDAHKLRPEQTWQTGDDALLSAGVPLLGVMRAGRGAMHDKFVVFDGRKVATGSFNWEWGSSFENHENMVLTSEPSLVRAYAERFDVVAGSVKRPRSAAADPSGASFVTFAPDEEPFRAVGRLIDGATKSLHIAMFTAKDVEYDEGGSRTSLLRKVVAAQKRGVAVHFMTDRDIAEASEYFGTVSDDDPTDEWLEQQGVRVILADPKFGKYASMHHKVMVVDGEIAVTGAFNWYYDAAWLNDEDVLVLRDNALASRFVGEFADLARRYDPAYVPDDYPGVELQVSVENADTQWGDHVLMLGDLAELGGWDPASSLALDGSSWPSWRATLRVPGGVRMRFKFATKRASGTLVWENGDDRTFTVPSGNEGASASFTFRRP